MLLFYLSERERETETEGQKKIKPKSWKRNNFLSLVKCTTQNKINVSR
jgi:hypothetical protein